MFFLFSNVNIHQPHFAFPCKSPRMGGCALRDKKKHTFCQEQVPLAYSPRGSRPGVDVLVYLLGPRDAKEEKISSDALVSNSFLLLLVRHLLLEAMHLFVVASCD